MEFRFGILWRRALEPANPETLHLDSAEQTADSVTETMIADLCPLSGVKRTL